jgi:uncharacterized protein (TIGR02284 family)
MNSSNRRAIETLNNLITVCKDGEKGYRNAAGDVKSREQLKELFQSYGEERGQFLSELLTEVHRLDVAAERKGTARAAVHRGWMNVKSAVPGRDPVGVIAECERGERAAVKDYEVALKRSLPEETRALLQKQYARIKEAHERMHAMKALATLSKLIATCRDGELGYRTAAAGVKATHQKELFASRASERAQFASELEAAARRLGDTPKQKGTFAALCHRGWMKTKAAFTRGDVASVIAECERGERAAVRHYKDALKQELPDDIRALVDKQNVKIKEAQAAIHAWKFAKAQA